jgi:hypothetical protein
MLMGYLQSGPAVFGNVREVVAADSATLVTRPGVDIREVHV